MRAATPGDLGTLPPPWTMGTGAEGATAEDGSRGPPPSPTVVGTTSPADAGKGPIAVEGDVAHSAPRSNYDYSDPIGQNDRTNEVPMRT